MKDWLLLQISDLRFQLLASLKDIAKDLFVLGFEMFWGFETLLEVIHEIGLSHINFRPPLLNVLLEIQMRQPKNFKSERLFGGNTMSINYHTDGLVI
jgi:hypothetical protein